MTVVTNSMLTGVGASGASGGNSVPLVARVQKAFRNYATRCESAVTHIGGSVLGGTTHLVHENKVPARYFRVVLPLCYSYSAVDAYVDNRQIACSIEYPANSGTRYSFLFNGVRNPTLSGNALNGGYAVSDILDLGFTIPDGVKFNTFTFIQDTSNATLYATVFTGSNSTGGNEGAAYSTTPVDSTVSGSITNSFTLAIGPSAILSEGTLPMFAICGDSIPHGANDQGQGDSSGNIGWLAKYLHRMGAGYIKATRPGEKAFEVPTNFTCRKTLLQLTQPTAIIATHGSNDMTVGGMTLANLKTSKINEAEFYRNLIPGVPLIGATVFPRVTTTDACATLVNQTPFSGFATLRVPYNDWLINTRGDGLFQSVLDITPWGQSSPGSNLWPVTGAANYATSDGTHPSGTIHNNVGRGLSIVPLAVLM